MPQKACPAVLPGQIPQQEGERLAPPQCSALIFWGPSSHTTRSGLLGDKPEELGVLQSRTANCTPPPLLGISLPCRAAFVVSCLSLSQGVLKSPSSPHLQLPLTAAPPDRANSQALPSQLVFPSHPIVNHTPPIKPCSKIICELTKLKTKQALCSSDPTLAHAAALVAASPVSVTQSSFLHEAL